MRDPSVAIVRNILTLREPGSCMLCGSEDIKYSVTMDTERNAEGYLCPKCLDYVGEFYKTAEHIPVKLDLRERKKGYQFKKGE